MQYKALMSEKNLTLLLQIQINKSERGGGVRYFNISLIETNKNISW